MRHVFGVTASKLVKQLLSNSEKPRRLGSEKCLAPEKVKLAYPSRNVWQFTIFFFIGNYSLKEDFNQGEECYYII